MDISNIQDRIQNARDSAQGSIDNIERDIENIRDKMQTGDTIATLLGGASAGIKVAPKYASKLISPLVKGSGKVIGKTGEGLEKVSNAISKPMGEVSDFSNDRARQIRETLSNLPENREITGEGLGEVENLFRPTERPVSEMAQQLKDRTASRLQALNDLPNEAEHIESNFNPTEYLNRVKSTAGDIGESVKSGIKSATETAGDVGKSIGKGLEDVGEKLAGVEEIPVLGEVADIGALGYGVYDVIKNLTKGKKEIREKQQEEAQQEKEISRQPIGDISLSQPTKPSDMFSQTSPLNF